ncbi:hypothetical protein M758_6G074200 [Ceratodon purpureus]|nr:hypothetical protein M758_6G074200 [Ceratodon purpureus]
MPHGKLDVYVEGAVGIKDTSLLGKGSPYCRLTMGTQVCNSLPVEEGGTHPYFNTQFEFSVDRSTQHLMVAIYSKKILTDDDLCGHCTIYFKDAFYHSHVVPVTEYALTRPSGRPGGYIRLSLTFRAQPRPPAPAPGAYGPPQPRPAAPYRQPRPPGPPPGSYAPPQAPHHPAGPPRQPRPPQARPSQAPYPPQGEYPPQQPQYAEPRRMDEQSSESSSQSSDSDGEDTGPPGPYQPQPQMQYAARGRGRVGPPPGRGGPRPRPPGPYMNQPVRGPAPPPQQPAVNNIMGSMLQNLGGMIVGAAVGSMLGSDGDGSDWGGGDDVSVDGSFGYVETASYGTLEDGYCEESAAVVESYESYESYEEREESSSTDAAAGAPGGAYQPVGYAPAPGPGARGRGRAGPPGVARGRGPPGARGGPPGRGRGPPGRAPMRGRGPIARGGPPPMRGRGPPAGYYL